MCIHDQKQLQDNQGKQDKLNAVLPGSDLCCDAHEAAVAEVDSHPKPARFGNQFLLQVSGFCYYHQLRPYRKHSTTIPAHMEAQMQPPADAAWPLQQGFIAHHPAIQLVRGMLQLPS